MNDLEALATFLATAPKCFTSTDQIKSFVLPTGETVSCVRWQDKFFITGTDIVRILLFRFQLLGRQIPNMKKFEEGIFSDLRNLKSGTDAVLESARSEFIEFLHRNGCIRTQKKQKVFFWHSVNHQRLFDDARDRDVRRESNLPLSLSYNGYNMYMNGFNGQQFAPQMMMQGQLPQVPQMSPMAQMAQMQPPLSPGFPMMSHTGMMQGIPPMQPMQQMHPIAQQFTHQQMQNQYPPQFPAQATSSIEEELRRSLDSFEVDFSSVLADPTSTIDEGWESSNKAGQIFDGLDMEEEERRFVDPSFVMPNPMHK